MSRLGIPPQVLINRIRHELRTLALIAGTENVAGLRSLVDQLEESITREKQ